MIKASSAVLDGEAYRIRFEVTIIASEADRIEGFFKAFQGIAQRVGDTLDSEWLDPFVDFIVYTVKRLELSLKADFVEFVLLVKDGAIRILVETMVPKKPLSTALHATRETNLRLIHFLMPPSGVDRALDTEIRFRETAAPSDGKTSLMGSLRQTSETQPVQEQGIHETTAPVGSVLYRKHVEELSWNGYFRRSRRKFIPERFPEVPPEYT